MGKKVYLGLSGGVDSALACALLVEQGYDVLAVYMRNWSRDLPGFRCSWADDLADAERIAVSCGVDLEVWDCEKEYKETVVDYLVDSYAHGYTPNPDVMCNQTVKFGTFAELAFARGADYVATGHYGRIVAPQPQAVSPLSPSQATASQTAIPQTPAHLLRARDEHKDQTYFLWRVPGSVLARTLFPIGDYASKEEVRQACAERGLGIESKPDSDGICFIGEVGIRTFLLDTLERRPGDIVEWETGRVLGHHDGAFLFTVGQRKGLGIGGGPKHYVVSTDVDKNIVYVTADRACPGLWTSEMLLGDCHWIAGTAPSDGRYLVRTRHTGELREISLSVAEDGASATIRFDQTVRCVAPGQSAVIYQGEECLGGGIIQPSASLQH